MKTIVKEQLQFLISVVLVLAGIGLLIAGLCIAPSGEIHASVLTATGECFSFAAAILGIYNYATFKIRQIKDEVVGEIINNKSHETD